MNISENGKKLIKEFEGCRLEAYKCPTGVWTIGYGHTGSDVYQGLKITQERAEALLEGDLVVHSNNVEQLVRVQLNQNRFDALVSFEYNIGYGNFSTSTLLKLLNAGDYAGAADQFGRWVYSGNTVLEGLVRRRNKERELFLKPD